MQTSKHDLLGRKLWEAKLGKRIDNWDPNASLCSRSRKDDGHADDLLRTHLAIPTFSSRFREALEYAGVATGDIQYLPIRIFQSTGKEVRGYAMANIVSRVAALNYEESSMLEQDETEIDPLTGRTSLTIQNAQSVKQVIDDPAKLAAAVSTCYGGGWVAQSEWPGNVVGRAVSVP